MLGRLDRDADLETGALAGLGGHRDVTAVLVDNFTGDEEPDAGSLGRFGRKEQVKNLRLDLLFHTDTVVLDGKDDIALVGIDAKRDLWSGLIRVFPAGIHRVFEDIDQSGAQLFGIHFKIESLKVFGKITDQTDAGGFDPWSDNRRGIFSQIKDRTRGKR